MPAIKTILTLLCMIVTFSVSTAVRASSDVVGKVESNDISDATIIFGSSIPAKSQVMSWSLTPADKKCVLNSVKTRFPGLSTYFGSARTGELPVLNPGTEKVEEGKITWQEFCGKTLFSISILTEPAQPDPEYAKGDGSLIGHLLSIRKLSDILCRCINCLYRPPGQSDTSYGSCSWCDVANASGCPKSPDNPIDKDPTDNGGNGGGR